MRLSKQGAAFVRSHEGFVPKYYLDPVAVPTIGVGTVERVAKAGGGCIAIGVGRVILIDRPAVLATADRLGVAIVGVR